MSLVSELKRPNIENYRDIERDSYSSLKMYDKNKWDYFKIYVEKDEEYIKKYKESKDTSSINTGNIIDLILTDPDNLSKFYYESTLEVAPAPQMLKFIGFLLKEKGEFSTKFENAYNKLCEWNGGKVKMTLPKYLEAFEKEGQECYDEQLKAGNRKIISIQEYEGIKRAMDKVKFCGRFKDEGDVYTKFPILFEYEDMLMKCEIDKFVVNDKEKIVYLYDYKTSFDPSEFIFIEFIKLKYYIQSGLYKFALQQWLNDNGKPGYKVENMAFRVIDSIGLQQPLVYQTTDKWFEWSFKGFYIGNKYYKGIDQIIEEIKFSKENNIWDIDINNYKNKGIIYIPEFEQK